MTEFEAFPKIARLNRDIVITEKIDGTNAAIGVVVDCCDESEAKHSNNLYRRKIGHSYQRAEVYAQSRSRILRPPGIAANGDAFQGDDNFGFRAWVVDHADVLAAELGPGLHFGEWWGAGIQRNYGLTEKRFSLFNTARWGFLNDPAYPRTETHSVLHCVPVLYEGPFAAPFSLGDPVPTPAEWALGKLRIEGSRAAPGYMNPEGIVIWHTAARTMFKATLEGDEKPKGSKE